MIKQSYTLQLDGSVSLERFTQALDAWRDTIAAVSLTVGAEHILSTRIDDLSGGSAIVNVEVTFDSEQPAEVFNRDYDLVGFRARGDNVVDFPTAYREPVEKLRRVAGLDGGEGMVIASETADTLISPSLSVAESSLEALESAPKYGQLSDTFGTVTGRLQSLTSRGGLRVVVYDDLFDRPVRCNLTQSQHENMRDLWDHSVIVQGTLRRDPRTGRPLSVKEVVNIYERKEPMDKYAWMKAKGAMRKVRPDLSSEELIRQARNG